MRESPCSARCIKSTLPRRGAIDSALTLRVHGSNRLLCALQTRDEDAHIDPRFVCTVRIGLVAGLWALQCFRSPWHHQLLMTISRSARLIYARMRQHAN